MFVLNRRLRLTFAVVAIMLVGYAAHAVKVFLTEPDHFGYIYRHGGREIVRVTSPDQRLDAVVYRQDTDSLSRDIFYLHLFPSRTERTAFDSMSGRAVLVSNEPIEVHWADPFHVNVDTATGTVRFFTNLWIPPDGSSHDVEIALVPSRRVLKSDGSFAVSE